MAGQENHPVAQRPLALSLPLSSLVRVVGLGSAVASSSVGAAPAAVILDASASSSLMKPVGTTMVMPFSLSSVVDAVGGHDVLSQSRPTRQQPPRYTASHW